MSFLETVYAHYYPSVAACLVVSHAHAQYIAWNAKRPLTWKDFQGKTKPHRKRFGATTYSKLHYKFDYTGTDSMRVTIAAIFLPERSWKRSVWLKYRLLKHEQGHFDIAELYARKLRYTIAQHQQQAGRIKENWLYIKCASQVKKMRRCQHRYDRQTNHSRRAARQQEWNTKIARELDELKGYSL